MSDQIGGMHVPEDSPYRNLIKFKDVEGDPIALDVVAVPEGFSFQMYDMRDTLGYQSVIFSPDMARRLVEFIKTHDHVRTRPHSKADNYLDS